MLPGLRDEIADHLESYLAGAETPRQLENWLLQASWNIHRHPDPMARSMAGKVGLYLAEYDRQHRTAEELRSCLQSVLADSRGLQQREPKSVTPS